MEPEGLILCSLFKKEKKDKIFWKKKKIIKVLEVPLLNFEGVPEVPPLNIKGVPGPTFKLWGGPRSRSLGLTFKPLLH